LREKIISGSERWGILPNGKKVPQYTALSMACYTVKNEKYTDTCSNRFFLRRAYPHNFFWKSDRLKQDTP